MGFTLTELSLAMALAGTTILFAGSIFSNIYQRSESQRRESTSHQQMEMALSFMALDIQMGSSVAAGNACTSAIAGFKPVSHDPRIQPILIVTPAANSGFTTPIVYYLAKVPNTDIWLSPKAVYRWGPLFDLDGTYSRANEPPPDNIANITSICATTASNSTDPRYVNEMTIDGIDDTAYTYECAARFTISHPPATEARGFHACIDDSHRAAQLWLRRRTHSTPLILDRLATSRAFR
jgi:type II secretory pathway pseudopilin PulG